LRLLVINISSSSPAINTAAYYQGCVITCDTLAVLYRRPRLQHLPVAALTQAAVKPDIIGSDSRFLPIPPALDAHVRGVPSKYCYAVWRGKTRMVWLPKGEKSLMICLFVLTQLTNVTDRQTDRPHDDIGRACIASRGKNGPYDILLSHSLRRAGFLVSSLIHLGHLSV